MDSIDTLFHKKEPLVPELVPYVEMHPFPVLRHPLIYSVPYAEQMNAYLNACFHQKQKAVLDALAQGLHSRYVFLHERPYRLDALADIAYELSDVEYWELARDVYQDSGNVEELSDGWSEILTADRPGRNAFMTAEEIELLEEMPQELSIWRGANAREDLEKGFSWSIQRKVAVWFAQRDSTQPAILAQGILQKEKVFAYLHTRNEFEIIAFPEDIQIQTVVQLPRRAR